MIVPFFKQKSDHTCGPASLRMVFAYYGKPVSEEEIAKKAGSNPRAGTTYSNMLKAARQKGFKCFSGKNQAFRKLKSFISKSCPVIVHYIDPIENEQAGHYAVVVKCEKNFVVLNDPWNGKGFMIRKDDFLKRWHANQRSRESNRWMLVLRP